uniref:Major facilitator superfamily (MFS) profile domain-containing protein n=1 Tax=Setaria viridis TaxID=4556 RepID=A0A4U6UE52_SETVI|nr:hypothetical protein SEVIR_5G062600v2 [Setaria viridis]
MVGPMEPEGRDAAGKPLLVRVAGGSGGNSRGSASSSSIAVVVGSTAVAVAGSFEFGLSIGYSSPSLLGIMRDLHLSLAEYSVFGSILTIGAMLGAIVSGSIADRAGRRGAMAISDVICALGYLLIAFSQNYWCLDIGRVLIGCGIGLLSYVFMICCGGSLAFVLGTFINWRTLAIVGVAPCLLQLLGLPVIPESPDGLLVLGGIDRLKMASSGHPGAFVAELQKLRGQGTDISEEASEIKVFTEKLQRLPKSKMLDLFQKDYLHAVIVGVGLMVLQQLGGVNGILFYASGVFVSAGFSSGNTGTVAMAVVQILMIGLGVLPMDKAGRRPLLMVSAAGTCLGCLLIGLSFLSKEQHWEMGLERARFGWPSGTYCYFDCCSIFPINMKGSAGSLVTLVNWLGSWIVSYAFNFLMTWSTYGTFFIFATICGLTVVFVERLVPETKGRTLEEIQASLNSSLTPFHK